MHLNTLLRAKSRTVKHVKVKAGALKALTGSL